MDVIMDWDWLEMSFPSDAPMAFVANQWVVNGNRIDATFTREQLDLCLKLVAPITMAEWKQAALRMAGIR